MQVSLAHQEILEVESWHALYSGECHGNNQVDKVYKQERKLNTKLFNMTDLIKISG